MLYGPSRKQGIKTMPSSGHVAFLKAKILCKWPGGQAGRQRICSMHHGLSINQGIKAVPSSYRITILKAKYLGQVGGQGLHSTVTDLMYIFQCFTIMASLKYRHDCFDIKICNDKINANNIFFWLKLFYKQLASTKAINENFLFETLTLISIQGDALTGEL